MKKMTLKMKLFGGLVGAALLAVSCAQGFDDNETFKSDVSNSQMESPTLTETSFSTRVNPDGSESVVVSWPVVKGANGYECKVSVVDDPANPIVLVDQVIDGCSVVFDRYEDTKYEVSIRTLGNKAQNNTDAEQAFVYAYSTLVPAITVPAGSDIAAFVRDNLDTTIITEQAFELEAGANYTITEPIDFLTQAVTFRGDKVNRPTVKLQNDACIKVAAGLKIKFINFDCTESNVDKMKYVYGSDKASSQYNFGFIVCGDADYYPESYKSQNFGTKVDAAYVLADPVIVQECNFKNVPKAFLAGGYNAWGVKDFRIDNCIIQLATIDDDADRNNFISFNSNCGGYEGAFGLKWNGGVQNILIKNSTIYNTAKTSKKVRFIRETSNCLNNIFGSHAGTFTMTDCTLYKTFQNSEFANNTPNNAAYVIKMTNNVFYEVSRLNKFVQGSCTKDGRMNNTSWAVEGNANENGELVSSSDVSNGIVVEEDPMFAAVPTVLDLTDSEKGGQNFKANGAISSTIGDPRWK